MALAGACAQTDQQEGEATVQDTAQLLPPLTAWRWVKPGTVINEFLRIMSDHHEGLIQMATAAMEKGAGASTKEDGLVWKKKGCKRFGIHQGVPAADYGAHQTLYWFGAYTLVVVDAKVDFVNAQAGFLL